MSAHNEQGELGVVVVGGAGGIGRSAHVPAAMACDLVRLVGVVDPNKDALRRVAEELGCWTSAELAEALARDDVHIVIIASPDFAHAEQSAAAARAGKHVLCEKPLALSLEEAQQVRRAAEAAGVKFMVGHSLRFHDRWRAVRRAVDGGAVGRPVLVQVWFRGRPFDYPADSFYRKPESVGLILHNGVHYFDLAAYLAGSPPVWVHAAALSHYPEARELPGENYWTVQMGFASGALGHVEYNAACVGVDAGRQGMGAMVVGTAGTVATAPEDARIAELLVGESVHWPGAHPPAGWRRAFVRQLEHFARCVIDDREPATALGWSIRILETALACVRSAREGRRVELGAGG